MNDTRCSGFQTHYLVKIHPIIELTTTGESKIVSYRRIRDNCPFFANIALKTILNIFNTLESSLMLFKAWQNDLLSQKIIFKNENGEKVVPQYWKTNKFWKNFFFCF